MLSDHFQGFSSHRAACKQWSAALSVIVLLVGGLVGLSPIKMLWATGPLLLLGVVEAGYAAQERRLADVLKANKRGEEFATLPPESASASVLRTAVAALSLSIWPFYLGLFAIVAVGGQQMAGSGSGAFFAAKGGSVVPAGMVRTVAAKSGGSGGCGAGGCGSAGGCGGGSCGASSGQGCSGSCGSKTTTAAASQHPMQPQYQTLPANAAMRPMQGGYPAGQMQAMPQGALPPQQFAAQSQGAVPQGGMPPGGMPPRLPNVPMVNGRPPAMVANPAAARAIPAPAHSPATGATNEAGANVAAPASVSPTATAAEAASASKRANTPGKAN